MESAIISRRFDGTLLEGARVGEMLDRLDGDNYFDFGGWTLRLSTVDGVAGYFLHDESSDAEFHVDRRHAVQLLEGVNFEFDLVYGPGGSDPLADWTLDEYDV